MCGIFAYTGTGKKDAGEVLLKGLTSLEYRGYDSAGVFTPESGTIRARGAVGELIKKIPKKYKGKSGIAHLRWATHGEPSEKNAHPHASENGEILVVHNGIIENFDALKQALLKKGHTFRSDTDTEVLAHLVEENLKRDKNFEKAALRALNAIRGTYGIAMQYKGEPDKLIAARMGSPIVIGIGKNERFIASDPSPILPHTRKVVFLEDGEVAILTPSSHRVAKLDSSPVSRRETSIEESVQKNGHAHFREKEIKEAPETLQNTLRGRLVAGKGMAKLGGLENVRKELREVERIIIVACGTAYYAGLIGEYMLEEYAGIPVEVELASEFRYRESVLNQKTALIAISQSGETLDTLEAVREGKRRGAITLGIVNAVGSTIARETDAGVYNHAGPEIGVASTKAFVSQLAALALFTLFFGRERGMSLATGKKIVAALKALPAQVAEALTCEEEVKALVEKYKKTRDVLFIGRRYSYPLAHEGALKLKELSYIHAEGYAAGEMKHGTLALIDEQFPTIAIMPHDSMYKKTLSALQQIKARKGPVIALTTKGNGELADLADAVVKVPKTLELLQPILSAIPLWFFAYHMAVARGNNPDRPRNLAKSVTTE
jgi:glutamine---fructose-6-phosphate transaminase (isomerizing)